MKIGDTATALREMESVPRSLRSTKMNVFLGRLYKSSGLRRHAITAFQEAVKANPLAIECVESLASLGVSANDIEEAVCSSSGAKEGAETSSLRLSAVVPVVRSLCAIQSSNYEGN